MPDRAGPGPAATAVRSADTRDHLTKWAFTILQYVVIIVLVLVLVLEIEYENEYEYEHAIR